MEGGEDKMVYVRRKKNESINMLLRRFSETVKESKILEKFKEHLFNFERKTRDERKLFAINRNKIKKLKSKLIKEGELEPAEKIAKPIINKRLKLK